ncbi:MAG: sulfotransferase family 2 domain-containing protein [Verrucomicrobia bacterium]|nr:sulfotransferase family 2 domain-containing protein [Verrucomicrobiota bacterium]
MKHWAGAFCFFVLISGHLAGPLLDEVHPNSCTITVLREPVDGIASHYYYAQRNPQHYLHEKIHREQLSLRDYVEQEISHELSNHYTLHFSGLSRDDAARDPDAAVEQALQGLRRYDLVGFQDDMSGFVAQLRRSANLRLPFPEQKVNVTQDRRSVQELDPATREVIERANALDLRLYADLRQIPE